jgi:hypothetical protein
MFGLIYTNDYYYILKFFKNIIIILKLYLDKIYLINYSIINN